MSVQNRVTVGFVLIVAGLLASTPTGARAGEVEDYDDGVANTFVLTGEVNGAFDAAGIGGLRVDAPSGFKNALVASVGRNSTLMNEILNGTTFQFARQSFDAPSTGTFINSFVVFQTDANGLNYKVLDNSAQFINPNADAVSPYSYNYATGDPAALDAFRAYAGGAGNFANVFLIQQSDAASAILYDDITITGQVPEPSVALALLVPAGVGSIIRRRRRRAAR